MLQKQIHKGNNHLKVTLRPTTPRTNIIFLKHQLLQNWGTKMGKQGNKKVFSALYASWCRISTSAGKS